MPTNLKTAKFSDSWDAWVKHRQEIGHPLKDTMADAQLKMLAKKGVDAAVAMIDHTVSMGWQGLRDPEPNGKPPTAPEKSKPLSKEDHMQLAIEVRAENERQRAAFDAKLAAREAAQNQQPQEQA